MFVKRLVSVFGPLPALVVAHVAETSKNSATGGGSSMFAVLC